MNKKMVAICLCIGLLNSGYASQTDIPEYLMVFEKYYEDQLADGEMTIDEYIRFIGEDRGARPGWKKYIEILKGMPQKSLACLSKSIQEAVNQYKARNMHGLIQFEAEIKSAIEDCASTNIAFVSLFTLTKRAAEKMWGDKMKAPKAEELLKDMKIDVPEYLLYIEEFRGKEKEWKTYSAVLYALRRNVNQDYIPYNNVIRNISNFAIMYQNNEITKEVFINKVKDAIAFPHIK